MRPTIAAGNEIPDFAKGQVRDLYVRWRSKVDRPYGLIYLD